MPFRVLVKNVTVAGLLISIKDGSFMLARLKKPVYVGLNMAIRKFVSLTGKIRFSDMVFIVVIRIYFTYCKFNDLILYHQIF
jgi:hypothetical protein